VIADVHHVQHAVAAAAGFVGCIRRTAQAAAMVPQSKVGGFTII